MGKNGSESQKIKNLDWKGKGGSEEEIWKTERNYKIGEKGESVKTKDFICGKKTFECLR